MSAEERPLSVRVRDALERDRELQIRPEYRASLSERLQTEAAVVATASAAPRARYSWLTIAAGIILVAGIGAGIQGWVVSGRFAALARLAAGDHQNCAIKFALDEKPISLADAAIRHDPAFGRLQNVAPASSTLTGGPIRVLERHSCVFRGRPFAHIVMAYKDHVVSVLVADRGAAGGEWWRVAAAQELPSAEGFQMASFQSADHMVFVVSSLPVVDVNEVTRAMLQPVSSALAGI